MGNTKLKLPTADERSDKWFGHHSIQDIPKILHIGRLPGQT